MKAAPSGGLNKSAPNSRASAAFSSVLDAAEFLLKRATRELLTRETQAKVSLRRDSCILGHSDLWRYCMRIAGGVLGALLILIGGIWILQGINVLPGSFMTGQLKWAVYGAIAAAAGLGLLWTAIRRPRR